MKYVLKQEFWSFGDEFIIRDEDGNDCYRVEGEIFSFGDQLSLLDVDGNELLRIEERLFTWGPSYEIQRPGGEVTVVNKEHFTFFDCRFEVDGPGREDYLANGDFMDHEYEVRGAGWTAATVSKQWFTWSDTYGVEITEGADTALMLAIAVVIDLICHGDRKH